MCFVTDCPLGTFGQDCSTQCHCLENTDCDAWTGTCSMGCAEGWTGETCSVQGNRIKQVNYFATNDGGDGPTGPIVKCDHSL